MLAGMSRGKLPASEELRGTMLLAVGKLSVVLSTGENRTYGSSTSADFKVFINDNFIYISCINLMLKNSIDLQHSIKTAVKEIF